MEKGESTAGWREACSFHTMLPAQSMHKTDNGELTSFERIRRTGDLCSPPGWRSTDNGLGSALRDEKKPMVAFRALSYSR